MRIIFAGTPEFAVPSLVALLATNHDVVLVLTQPDRPAGRGMASSESAIKQAAAARSLALYQPARMTDPGVMETLRAARAQVMVVAAYGLILPQAVLDVTPLGAVNVHASLLPRWRGAAPIQRALLAGDTETGVCLMQMDAGLDTGGILGCERLAIAPDETAGSLQDRLAILGARMLVGLLPCLASARLQATPQPPTGASYAAKIQKDEARIQWGRSAVDIERQTRAFNPFPGAWARMHAGEVKIWRAAVSTAAGEAGTVLSADAGGVCIACGTGALVATELQRAGGRKLLAAEFLRGFRIVPGARLESD